MDHFESEIKRAKRTNYIIFAIFAGLFLAMILAGFLYQSSHTFTTEKWERNPEERTRIVDDLLSNHELVGMTEAEIISLLGADNNDYGYFNKTDRYVYYLGPERGLISIDSEWLILDFTYGIVTHCYITTDRGVSMMDFKELERSLSAAIEDLIPAPTPDESDEFEMVTLDRGESDNSKWLAHITPVLEGTKTFEIHCWNEEAEWIDLALQYGRLKDDPWKYGKVIVGNVTPAFVQMLLSQPKPTDIELENKMTPFFNVFLDNNFQSCHYGTELYIRSMR